MTALEFADQNQYTYVRRKLDKIPMSRVENWVTDALGHALFRLKCADQKAYEKVIAEIEGGSL